MQSSYTINYLKIYLWQGLAMVLNIGSMAIVTPMTTSSPGIYGIYSLCIAANIFLQYADIGFVGAAYKYASESFARKDLPGEIKVIGFASFILLLFVSLYAAAIFACSLNPSLLIKNLHDPHEFQIASRLLLILAIFSPVTILQRFLQVVYGVRVEDYIYQRLALISSVARLASVSYFFSDGKYDIVGYFLFSQSISLLLLISSCVIAKVRYGYDFLLFFKSIRFSRPEFRRMKALAFSSLYTTLIWVAFYEMDLFAIGKLLGPRMVGIYAVGFTLVGFLRGIYGTVYSPFMARFNHFHGQGQEEELKVFYLRVIVLTVPIVVFPILSLTGVIRPFILSWVGPAYTASIPITILLILCYIYSFLSFPASILVTAQERLKELNLISTVVLAVVWIGVFLTYSRFQALSFALFKFVGFSIYGIFYAHVTCKYLRLTWFGFARKVLAPILVPALIEVAGLYWVAEMLPAEKGKLNLLYAIATGGFGSALAFGLYYLFSLTFRDAINSIVRKLLPLAKVIPL